MVCVLGAMDAEIDGFVATIDFRKKEIWNGFPFTCGVLYGHEVVIAKSGVGKTLSAMVTQRIIDAYAPTQILVTGIAGALNTAYGVGDTVIAESCVQHDMDATALGFARGEVPYTRHRFIECDARLVDAAAEYKPTAGSIHRGRIVTGDVFVRDRSDASVAYLTEELSGDAVEMEGASIGLVAAMNGIGFLLIRTISDLADGTAPRDFSAFLRRVARNSLMCVRHVLDTVAVDAQRSNAGEIA